MTFLRAVAAALTAFVLVLALGIAPTMAQARPPSAAPTPPPAESQTLGAPTQAVDLTLIGAQSSAMDQAFTPWALFLRADIVVKAAMAILLIASFWSWALIIQKWIAYGGLKRRFDKFEQTFWSGRSLDDLYQQYVPRTENPLAVLFVAGLREWKRAFEHGTPAPAALMGARDRAQKAMAVTIQRELTRIEKGLGFLATVGSTAPFIGLFGTVWGIMNSFRAIAARHDTTLAVVAPGIAEALFATALGLLAAIPAVVFYNKFVNDASGFAGRLDNFAEELSAVLSRQLDERSR